MGLVDLHHGDAHSEQVAGEPGAVGPGGFHPDPLDRAQAAQPAGELLVAGCGGGEGGVAKAMTDLVERDRVVDLSVAVDPADDDAGSCGHPDRAAPFLDGRRTGRDGRTQQ